MTKPLLLNCLLMPIANETLPQLEPKLGKQSDGNILLAGIALSSFAALLLELSLTRLFSVVLFYHFAFLAISVALLGLGAGGVFAFVWKKRLARWESRSIASAASTLSAIVIPIVLQIVVHQPVSLKLSVANFGRLALIYTSSAIPFFLTGLQFSVIFARESSRIPRLYGADLTGGAIACLAVVPLLNWIGAPNSILFAGLVSAITAAIWSLSKPMRRLGLGLTAALVSLIALNASNRLIDVVWAKGVRRKNIEFSRWNAISRVDVLHNEDGSRVIKIDADAGTHIMNADLSQWQGSEVQRRLMSEPPGVVNALRPHGDYAIIGPGGGVDVLRALANGSHSVTGIEINPTIANTIMRGRYADYAHHLYERPDVHLHVGDGRSFLRSVNSTFDVVQMTLVDTWASTAAGAFALSENNLYTTQAFKEYFEHLKPDGIIAITRWEFREPREALRVVSVAMHTLQQLGVRDVSHHFLVVAYNQLNEDGIAVAVLAKKSPFTAEEETTVKQFLSAHPPLNLLYAPSERGENAFTRLLQSNDPYTFSAKYPYNVSPVTDNAPFFFFTLKPENIWRSFLKPGGIDWKVNLGVAVLVMLLFISVIAVLAFLIVPLILQTEAAGSPAPILYFVAIGLGYILAEVTFIQRFVLFLGHPTYALTVVVFLMLLSSGVGSVVSRQWIEKPRTVWVPLFIISSGLLVYVWILPALLDRLVGVPFVGKLMISALVLAPLGFAMGMPFPAGLRSLAANGREAGNSIEWAWAMNAASSVLGSVLAIIIAIQFGLNVTLICGAVAYLLALMLRGKLLGAPSRA
jgi:SAM-dependent methyltransferase